MASDDPYTPPPETAAQRPRTLLERLFPAVILVDVAGCVVFLGLVLATVLLVVTPPEDWGLAWLAFWFVLFIGLHLVRVSAFILADLLLVYRNRLCYVPFAVGYALTILRLLIEPRLAGYNPWIHAGLIVASVGWNAFFLVVARAHLRGGGAAGPA